MRDFSNCMDKGGFLYADGFWLLMAVFLAWTIFWKGAALWHAARRKESLWFMALLLINTLGILEIFYLFVIAKVKVDKLFK